MTEAEVGAALDGDRPSKGGSCDYCGEPGCGPDGCEEDGPDDLPGVISRTVPPMWRSWQF